MVQLQYIHCHHHCLSNHVYNCKTSTLPPTIACLISSAFGVFLLDLGFYVMYVSPTIACLISSAFGVFLLDLGFYVMYVSPTIACLISSAFGVFLLTRGFSTDATCLIFMFDFFCMIGIGAACSIDVEMSGIGAAPCWSLGDCADFGSMLGMLGRSMVKFRAGRRLISSEFDVVFDVFVCCWRRKRGGNSWASVTRVGKVKSSHSLESHGKP